MTSGLEHDTNEDMARGKKDPVKGKEVKPEREPSRRAEQRENMRARAVDRGELKPWNHPDNPAVWANGAFDGDYDDVPERQERPRYVKRPL